MLWRTLWANDERVLASALENIAAGGSPDDAEVEPLVVPMLSGTGNMWETWHEMARFT